jgi:hypothetical protein
LKFKSKESHPQSVPSSGCRTAGIEMWWRRSLSCVRRLAAAAWRWCFFFLLPPCFEVLVGLYRQGTQQGDAPPPLLCIHEKYASAVACSCQQIVRHTTSLVHEGYSGVCWDTDYLQHATYKFVYWFLDACACRRVVLPDHVSIQHPCRDLGEIRKRYELLVGYDLEDK